MSKIPNVYVPKIHILNPMQFKLTKKMIDRVRLSMYSKINNRLLFRTIISETIINKYSVTVMHLSRSTPLLLQFQKTVYRLSSIL